MPPKHEPQATRKEDHLPYQIDYLPEFLKKRAKSELFEDEETKAHSLKLLRSMLKDEPDLKWQDEDAFLTQFLRARKYDVKRAYNMVKAFYTAIGKRSELFCNIDFNDVKKIFERQYIGYLPHRCSEGCAILVIRTSPWDPHVDTMGEVMRALSMSLCFAILPPATQIAGFKVIFDFSGVALSKLPHVSPTYLWLLAEALQNCFPARFRAVHMVNVNSIWSYVWAILKQPLNQKLRDRFHLHGKNHEKLHKYFSPSILPVEYGGEQPPFDNTEWYKDFLEHKDYIFHVLSFGYKKHKNKADEKCKASSSHEKNSGSYSQSHSKKRTSTT